MRNDVVIEVEIGEGYPSEQLDLDPKQAITLEYKSNLLSSIENITCSSSYTIKVPHTRRNDNCLHFAKVPSFNSRQLYRKIKCHVYVNGIDMVGDAWCYITDSDKDTYSLVITFGLMQNLGSWLTNKPKLKDLDDKAYNSQTVEYIDWDANAGVTVWANSFRSKYTRQRKSMFFGTYDCGVNDTTKCNIHPVVTLRELYERIVSENNLNFTMPSEVLRMIKNLCLLLTSDNTRGEVDYTPKLKAEGHPERIVVDEHHGDGEGTFLAIAINNENYYNMNVPHNVLNFNNWLGAGFVRKGDKHVTIETQHSGYIYVTGSSTQNIKSGMTYQSYFATGSLSDMKLWYPVNGDYTYITPSRVNVNGVSMVRFTLPNVVSKSYGNYVGLLLFSFRLATGNHELASFNGDYVNVGQYYNGAWADGIDFNYTYTLKEQGYPGWGKFNLVENLPDISQIDFIKSICQMFGLFVVAGTGDNVKFVRFSELSKNITDKKVYEWGNVLVDTGRDNPYKIAFTVNDYARRNKIGYKHDDNDPRPKDSVAYLEVDNEVIEKEKNLVEFPWAASTMNENPVVPIIRQYSLNEENQTVVFAELAYRLLKIDGITDSPVQEVSPGNDPAVDTDSDAADTAPKTLSFPEWLEAEALVANNYSDYQEAIRKPKIITEKIRLNEYELKNLDFTKPVYLDKYGRYFAIISVRWSSTSDTSEVKMLML